MAQRKGKPTTENPKDIVSGFRQAIQDLLMTELKALQVRVESLETELREHRRQTAGEFTRIWQSLTQLFETQHHTQLVLQRILERQKASERHYNEQFERIWQVLSQILEENRQMQIALRETQAAMQQTIERISVMERRCDEQFERLWQVISQLLEENRQVQVALRETQVALQQTIERMNRTEQRYDEQFAQIRETQRLLLESSRETQVALRQMLERLDISDELKETRAKQQMVEEWAEHLEEEVRQLRELVHLLLCHSGISPSSSP